MSNHSELVTEAVYQINMEINNINGGNGDKEALAELLESSSNPVCSMQHAYKMICKMRNVTPKTYILAL